MKSKAINRIASLSAGIGFLLFLLLIWQWYGQSQYGPPRGTNPTNFQPIHIGDLVFMAMFFPKIGLTLLAMMLAFMISFVSTMIVLFSSEPRQSQWAWIPLCIFLNSCIFIFLKHNLDALYQQPHFAFLLMLSFVGFGFSVIGALGTVLFAVKKPVGHEETFGRLLQLFAAGGFLLGMVSFVVFAIANFFWK